MFVFICLGCERLYRILIELVYGDWEIFGEVEKECLVYFIGADCLRVDCLVFC